MSFFPLNVTYRKFELFSVPELKQEYFHNNRYPTIPGVVYITTILPIVCICLITSQRGISAPPSQPPQEPIPTVWRRALPSMHVNIPLSTPVENDHFDPCTSHCIFVCIVGSENVLQQEPRAPVTINKGRLDGERIVRHFSSFHVALRNPFFSHLPRLARVSRQLSRPHSSV